jgi:hypothetical protein
MGNVINNAAHGGAGLLESGTGRGDLFGPIGTVNRKYEKTALSVATVLERKASSYFRDNVEEASE